MDRISYTEFGVPHIESDSVTGLGRGAGFTMAEQFADLVIDRARTVRGIRSALLGPQHSVGSGPEPSTVNLHSDLFWAYLRGSGALETAFGAPAPLGPSELIRDLFAGFAQGFDERLGSCTRNDDLDLPLRLTADDVMGTALHWNIFRSSIALVTPLVAAAPPGSVTDPRLGGEPSEKSALPDESNMIALGREITATGRGMLYANPHWFWQGPDSFREMHLRLSGVLDAYGSVVPGIPLIMSGFTPTLAFAGTSSLSPRYTVYRMTLHPDDPTQYLYEGDYHPMDKTTVQVSFGPDGTEVVEKTFYSTQHGLMLGGERYPWSRKFAYCVRDVGLHLRWPDQQWGLMTAKSAGEADERSRRYLGVGWRNLAVADRDGQVLYADRTAIPNVTDEQLAQRVETGTPGAEAAATDVAVLDGASADSWWADDLDAPVCGIIGPSRLPILWREDYVANENDSHWTNHATALLEGYPQVVGAERAARTLRTRNGLDLVGRLIAETEGAVTLATLREATERDLVWSAVLWRDGVVQECCAADASALREAARVLDTWDRSERLRSRGALLWRRFFHHFAGDERHAPEHLFNQPFAPTDPVGTPGGLDVHAGIGVVAAMEHAVADFGTLPLDVSVEEAQFVRKGDQTFGVAGGPHAPGQYNVIETADGWVHGVGYPAVVYGTGYRLWVEFTDGGPVAESVLAYSQSTDPESDHFTDQTALQAVGGTKSVRFTMRDVLAHRERHVVL